MRVNLLFHELDLKRELCKTIHELRVTFKMQVTFYLSSFDFLYDLKTDHLQIEICLYNATYRTTLESQLHYLNSFGDCC